MDTRHLGRLCARHGMAALTASTMALIPAWTQAGAAAPQSPRLERVVGCTDRYGPLRSSIQIAGSGAGRLLGADPQRSRVFVFSLSGSLVADWEVKGGLRRLTGDLEGHVYVLGKTNRIDEFSADGVQITSWTPRRGMRRDNCEPPSV